MIDRTLARRTVIRSAALPLALAACGAPGGETGGPTVKPALRSGVNLIWSVGGSAGTARETMRREMVAMFNAQHPGIDVELLFGHTGPEKLFTLFAGGNPPDLFRVSTQPYAAFVDQGLVRPMDDLMKRDRFDRSDFFPAALDQWKFRGKQWALPFLGIRVGYVNVGAYREVGAEPPSMSWKAGSNTWEQFLEAAQSVTRPTRSGDLSRFGFRVGTSQRDWQPWVWGNGGHVFSTDGKRLLLDEPASLDALQFLADLIHKHRVSPTAADLEEIGNNQITALSTGRLAMYHAPINNVARLRSAETGVSWSLAALPHGPARGAKARSSGGGVGWFLPTDGKNVEEAWALLQTVQSKEGVRLEAMTGEAPPSRKSIAYSDEYLHPTEAPGDGMKVVVEALEVIQPDLPLVKGPEVEDVIAEGLKPLWDGQQTARQAVAALKPQADVLLGASA